jgi:DNA-binding transcriptional ArsR family regulator
MDVERKPSPVLDLARPEGIAVEVDFAEAIDVLMSIWAIGGRPDADTFDEGRSRLEELRNGVAPDLLAAIDELTQGNEKIPAHLFGLVWKTPRPRTLAAFVDHLSATDPLEVQLHLLGYYTGGGEHGPSRESLKAAAGGDPGAIAEVVDALAEWPEACRTANHLLELGAGEVKERLLWILPRWYDEVYVPNSAEARRALQRDAETKGELARTRSAEQLVELATNGVQYSPGPGISRIVLVPGYWQRPWVLMNEYKHVKIFCYPLAPDHGAEGPTPAELARLYKALADEGRLRLLKRVSAGPMTLTEAAQELGVAKSTAHHHLALLRAAGLVVTREVGDDKVYNLRRDLLPQAGALLQSYVG